MQLITVQTHLGHCIPPVHKEETGDAILNPLGSPCHLQINMAINT